jgi:hypothetical protein
VSFRLADVKKTVRTRLDGERYLHPKLLDDELVGGQVRLALAYFQSRLGRARRDMDPETLVRIFGDPKIARGIVSCLSGAFHWRAQTFPEVLDPGRLAWLHRRGIATPGDLRLYLYDTVNAGGAGFLPYDREEHLFPIARRLRLTPVKLDQLAALDAEEHAVLVGMGAVPEPDEVVALYNFQVVDAVLRHSAEVELHRVGVAARQALARCCEAQGVEYRCEDDTVILQNRADAFGSYARWGARLSRALYTAAGATPALLGRGRARVEGLGKPATYLLERSTLRALTGGTGVVRAGDALPEMVDSWARQRPGGGAGWRLLGTPEPAARPGVGLVLTTLACRRDETQVLLWRADSPGALADLQTLHRSGLPVLALLPESMEPALPDDLPSARLADGASGLLAGLGRWWPQTRADAAAQALEGLLREVGVRGFIAERQVADALGCAGPADLQERLRDLDPERGAYVAGVGLCSPAFAETMRKGLRRKPRRKPAA